MTVRAGGGTPVSATLGPPPLPEPGTVAYSAAVRITAGVTVTVTAVDDLGRKATAAVTVRTVYTTPWSRQRTLSKYPDRDRDALPYLHAQQCTGHRRDHPGGGSCWQARACVGSKCISDCAITTDYMIDCGELVGAVKTR